MRIRHRMSADTSQTMWMPRRHQQQPGQSGNRRHCPERQAGRVPCLRGSDLTDFSKCFVAPYFARQAYYQVYRHWPPGRKRSHGVAGIIESFSDTLADLGPPSVAMIERLLFLPSVRVPSKQASMAWRSGSTAWSGAWMGLTPGWSASRRRFGGAVPSRLQANREKPWPLVRGSAS